MSNKRNPSWQRDELILALDLYFRHRPDKIGQEHPEVLKLSRLLNDLPIHEDRPDRTRFRNPSGVYLKLCNFLRFDPSYQGKGMTHGGALEMKIWDEFAGQRALLARIAEAIRAGHRKPEAIAGWAVDGTEEEEFPEGRVLYRVHRARERNRTLVKRKKALVLKKHGRIACEACGFDFGKTYGRIGEGYIECHHIVPLSELQDEKRTRVEDLVLVCSNCHRMIHRRRPWLRPDELTKIVADANAALSGRTS